MMTIMRAPYIGEDLFDGTNLAQYQAYQAALASVNPSILVTPQETGNTGEAAVGYAYALKDTLPVGKVLTFSAFGSTAVGGEAFIQIFDITDFAAGGRTPLATSPRNSTSTPTFMTLTVVIPAGGWLSLQLLQTTAGKQATFTNPRVTIR